jgi:hypothetical protein
MPPSKKVDFYYESKDDIQRMKNIVALRRQLRSEITALENNKPSSIKEDKDA